MNVSNMKCEKCGAGCLLFETDEEKRLRLTPPELRGNIMLAPIWCPSCWKGAGE